MWVRIQRRRRTHRLVALALTLTAGAAGAVLARARLVERPVQVRTDLETPLRTDGSAPLHARWQVRYTGAELRVYRNALGAVLRCPGSPQCMLTPGGGSVTFVADVAGEYRALAFPRPVPVSGATMQEDLAEARARSDRVEISPSLVVY